MRTAALAGLFVGVIIATGSSTASAEALGLLQLDNIESDAPKAAVLVALETRQAEPAEEAVEKKPNVEKYTVADNDSLHTIAGYYETTWKRLFYKNSSIADPDVITVGDELVIPLPDEKLKERPLPPAARETAGTTPAGRAPARKPQSTRKPAVRQAPTAPAVQARGSVAGNTYTAGYCTWYVKNRRPDLPNNLGNADTWVSRARAQGIPTGATPRVGAAGQRGMHVVYVESINGDGTVNISEMNHKGLYVRSERTLPADYFMYIY